MKIMLIAPYWFGGVSDYCKTALIQQGCEVESFISDRVNRECLEDRLLKKLPHLPASKNLELFRRYLSWRADKKSRKSLDTDFVEKTITSKPDAVIFLIGLSSLISPEALETIKRKTKIPLIVWYLDDPFLSYEIAMGVKYFDHIFAVDPIFVQQLKLLNNCPVLYLPGAVDPNVYKPTILSDAAKDEYSCEIAFLGSVELYENGGGVFRAQILGSLAEYNVKVFGNPAWEMLLGGNSRMKKMYRGGPLLPAEVNKLYNAAQIALNVHRPQMKSGVNPKTYEIAAAGAFQLVDNKQELKNQFEIGKEMICYESAGELKELAEYYLRHPEERKLIADLARQRVLKEHTYQNRIESILREI